MNEFFNWLFTSQTKKSGARFSSKKENQFKELKSIWEESAKLSTPEAPDNQLEWMKLQRAIKIAENKAQDYSQNPFTWFVKKPKLAVAFSFIALSFIAASIFIYLNIGTTIYQTANKEKTSVVLADGSIIQLNSGSKLRVLKNFNKRSRTISLEGEAYFEIQNSPAPFRIQTEIGDVTVLGTKFNINSRNSQMEVAVNEGRVQVTSTVSQKDSSVVLTKGELCVCESGQYPDAPQIIDFTEYPGWIHSKMTLEETELSFVLEEIERRFDVKIQQKDKQLDSLEISGLFDASDLDNLMSSICILIQKEYRQENNLIIIY